MRLKNSQSTSYQARRSTRILFLSASWLQFSSISSGVLGNVLSAFSPILELISQILISLYIFFALAISRILYWLNQKAAHRQRTARATQLIQGLEADEMPSFNLYLRPFITSENLHVENSRYLRKFLPSMDRFYGKRVDLETIFAIAFEKSQSPLIAIGETGFELGAAKITSSENDWRSVFYTLSDNAQSVLMIPLPTPSTFWELQYICSNKKMLEKTLFAMPMRLRSGVKESLEPYWKQISESMKIAGIEFPDFETRGGLFMLSDSRHSVRWLDSGGFDIQYLESVLDGMSSASVMHKELDILSKKYGDKIISLFSQFLTLSDTSEFVQSKGIPLFEFEADQRFQGLVDELREINALVIHRSQIASQGWLVVQVHPRVYDWQPLSEWIIQGDIFEGNRNSEQDAYNEWRMFDEKQSPDNHRVSSRL